MMDTETEAMVARLTKEVAELKLQVDELKENLQRVVNQAGTCCDED